MADTDTKETLRKLFDEAGAGGGVEYIYTLVRVTGITRERDSLLVLRDRLAEPHTELQDPDALARYCSLATIEEPLCLVTNLLLCKQGKPYDAFPFSALYSGQLAKRVKPSTFQIVQQVTKMATETGELALTAIINDAYPAEVLQSCRPDGPLPVAHASVQGALAKLHAFLACLLEIYFEERLKFREGPRLAKLAGFEVIECLVDEEFGLHGFRMHFSTGSSATFDRTADSTTCIGINPRTPISFYVGELEKRRPEWRIGEKRLYEVGLPGRYNAPGEWKPLIYPGESQALQKDAHALSVDPDVQGALFYMMCTGHRAIEFVVRTNIDVPLDEFSFGEHLHLFKCPPLDADSPRLGNYRLYDGTYELASVDTTSIAFAIAMIGIGVNRMAFAYGGIATWRLKYPPTIEGLGVATPTKDDLQVLDSLLRNFPERSDAIILDYAIDWYNRGLSERSVFTRFLCFYIALESVAVAVTEGDADLGLAFSSRTKEEQAELRSRCIAEKYNELYAANPERFVREAYFDCVIGLNRRTRQIVELVFGTSHDYLDALFRKRDGHSLSEIRGMLAHGRLTLLDRDDEKLVRARLPEIARISREFLTRVIFLLKPADALPTWSQHHSFSMVASDPRMTMVISDIRMLPTKDWRIRPEWCE